MICKRCGTENADTAGFCKNCGAPLASGEPHEPRPPRTSTPNMGTVPSQVSAQSIPYLTKGAKIWLWCMIAFQIAELFVSVPLAPFWGIVMASLSIAGILVLLFKHSKIGFYAMAVSYIIGFIRNLIAGENFFLSLASCLTAPLITYVFINRYKKVPAPDKAPKSAPDEDHSGISETGSAGTPSQTGSLLRAVGGILVCVIAFLYLLMCIVGLASSGDAFQIQGKSASALAIILSLVCCAVICFVSLKCTRNAFAKNGDGKANRQQALHYALVLLALCVLMQILALVFSWDNIRSLNQVFKIACYRVFGTYGKISLASIILSGGALLCIWSANKRENSSQTTHT